MFLWWRCPAGYVPNCWQRIVTSLGPIINVYRSYSCATVNHFSSSVTGGSVYTKQRVKPKWLFVIFIQFRSRRVASTVMLVVGANFTDKFLCNGKSFQCTSRIRMPSFMTCGSAALAPHHTRLPANCLRLPLSVVILRAIDRQKFHYFDWTRPFLF